MTPLPLALRDQLNQQLALPRGPLARPLAWLLNRFNGADYVRALAALELEPELRVLELGFGGGLGLEALLRREVEVVGVEPSDDLRRRAARRLAAHAREGRLTLLGGHAGALPPGPFDRALSMNTLPFWEDVPAGLAALREAVDGRVVLGVAEAEHLRAAGFERAGHRVQPVTWYARAMRAAGFIVHVERAPTPAGAALLIGD